MAPCRETRSKLGLIAGVSILAVGLGTAQGEVTNDFIADQPGGSPAAEWQDTLTGSSVDLTGGISRETADNGFASANTIFQSAYQSDAADGAEAQGPSFGQGFDRATVELWFRRDFSQVDQSLETIVESGASVTGFKLGLRKDTNDNTEFVLGHVEGNANDPGEPRVEFSMDINQLDDSDFIHAGLVFNQDGEDPYQLFAREASGDQTLVTASGTQDRGDRPGNLAGANESTFFNDSVTGPGPSGQLGPTAGNASPFSGELARVRFDNEAQPDSTIAGRFDQIVNPLTLQVNDSTGNARLVNPANASTDKSPFFYQIDSESGSLTPETWSSLEDRGVGSGGGWQEAGGSDSDRLGEAFVDGESALAPGESLFLGEIFDPAGTQDLQLTFSGLNTGPTAPGLVEFISEQILQPGDMNSDGQINNLDINPFVLGLTDEQAFIDQFGFDPATVGDINGDGEFNNLDINPFVSLLTGGSGLQAVPEPASLALLGLGGLTLMGRRRRAVA